LLDAEMKGEHNKGHSLREEVTVFEKAEKEKAAAQDYKERIGDRAEKEWEVRKLELFARDVFNLFSDLIRHRTAASSRYLDITQGQSEHQLHIFRDDAGYRAIFKLGDRHIDLVFYRETDGSIFIKQHMGRGQGTRTLPENATSSKNNYDFAGENLLFLKDELMALSEILEADDDFATDLSFLSA
ncbi:hypothetical protein KC721_02085, partial [Candidatus Woesebacteria bacterium]|nr:hypothetical protein [Candidatus Woesebacteria bacterium]